jgi:hypothetical protein
MKMKDGRDSRTGWKTSRHRSLKWKRGQPGLSSKCYLEAALKAQEEETRRPRGSDCFSSKRTGDSPLAVALATTENMHDITVQYAERSK